MYNLFPKWEVFFGVWYKLIYNKFISLAKISLQKLVYLDGILKIISNQKGKSMKELISKLEIQSRILELGQEISKDHTNDSILAIGILKGSFIFMADLVREIKSDVEVEFLSASSYGSEKTSSGIVKLEMLNRLNLKDKNIILVEDIIDTGLTLNKIVDEVLKQSPRSLKVCSLLVKKDKHSFQHNIDYVGFNIEDRFVVGYGLDFNGRFRNLPYVAVLD
ncbi:MAG: hypoxanthine phosphoribosyltransferase [Leptospiraceae bacterium]|nr:hypoxanthine phosphoribosyltransferase [Leptospiraceae bacterium]